MTWLSNNETSESKKTENTNVTDLSEDENHSALTSSPRTTENVIRFFN